MISFRRPGYPWKWPRLPLGGAAVVLLTAAHALGQPEPEPVVTVDDAALHLRFQQEMEALIGTAGIPKGSTLLEAGRSGKPPVDLGQIDQKVKEWPQPADSPSIYSRSIKGTLMVGHLYQCGRCSKWHASVAGGVVLDPSGIAVTNFHVMNAPKAEVFGAMTHEGEVFPIIEVLAASPSDDAAIIRLKTGDRKLTALPLAAGDDPVGSEVRVISHPDGRLFTFSEGIISRYFFEPSAKAPRVQITADYARGSSGCGVFNERGGLVGIVSSTNSIYYTVTPEDQKNLQMVVKSCVPVASIRKLLRVSDPESVAEKPSGGR